MLEEIILTLLVYLGILFHALPHFEKRVRHPLRCVLRDAVPVFLSEHYGSGVVLCFSFPVCAVPLHIEAPCRR